MPVHRQVLSPNCNPKTKPSGGGAIVGQLVAGKRPHVADWLMSMPNDGRATRRLSSDGSMAARPYGSMSLPQTERLTSLDSWRLASLNLYFRPVTVCGQTIAVVAERRLHCRREGLPNEVANEDDGSGLWQQQPDHVHRQPSAGATWVRIDSMIWALYATPS
jgi:hypothetical protein